MFLTTFLIRKPIGREAAAHELNKPGYVDEKSTGNPVGAVRNAKWSCFKVGAPRQQLDGVSDFPNGIFRGEAACGTMGLRLNFRCRPRTFFKT